MNLQQFNPWNWFKHENMYPHTDVGDRNIPVTRDDTKNSLAARDNILGPWLDFHREIDRLFDGFFSRGLTDFPDSSPSHFTPSLDLSADDNHYTVSVEMPGLEDKDVNIELSDNVLTIRGEKREEKELDEKNYYRVERRYGKFQRVLTLPDDVDQEHIQAKMSLGVLHLILPRKQAMKRDVKKIEINKLN
jgi:HSP20 family protein